MYKTILLFGAPGSGKGTQGKMLGAIPGFIHKAMGDIFRALDRGSELGRLAFQYSSRGQLVPDEFTVKLWRQHVCGMEYVNQFRPSTDILLLDGIPRNVVQAKLMADVLDVRKIVFLSCDDYTPLVERLRKRAIKEKRADDADEKVIRERMMVYERETKPVLDFYPQDRIARVDASLSPIAVFSEIVKVLVPVKEAVDREIEEAAANK